MTNFPDNRATWRRFVGSHAIVATMLVGALLWTGANPVASASRSFSFEGCSWSSTTHEVSAAGLGAIYSHSLTFDHNGGCGYMANSIGGCKSA